MSEEFLDISAIQSSMRSNRGRKNKYTTKLWENVDPKGKARYALRMAENWDRRQSKGEVEGENPYIGLVGKKFQYEIEMETVFHSDPESDSNDSKIAEVISDEHVELDDEEVPEIEEWMNEICDLKIMNDFYVATEFCFDVKMNDIVARVPAGLVTKKMSLRDIFKKVDDFRSSAQCEKMRNRAKTDKKLVAKLAIIDFWWTEASIFLEDVNV